MLACLYCAACYWPNTVRVVTYDTATAYHPHIVHTYHDCTAQEVSSLTQQLQEIKRLSGQCEAALRAKGAERDAIKAQQDALNDRKLALGHEAKEARRQ